MIVSRDHPFLLVQHAPAVSEQAIDGGAVEEALGLTVDEIEVLRDGRVARGAVVMVVGRIEATDQEPVGFQYPPNALDQLDRLPQGK